MLSLGNQLLSPIFEHAQHHLEGLHFFNRYFLRSQCHILKCGVKGTFGKGLLVLIILPNLSLITIQTNIADMILKRIHAQTPSQSALLFGEGRGKGKDPQY
jgi:hypothetical protein